MYRNLKVFVAGHTGLLGSALVKALNERGCTNVITRAHKDMDLADKNAVLDFFSTVRPDCVFLCAGKVGGIESNLTYPADYLRTNLTIQNSIFEAALQHHVGHVVFYGSSCTYPKLSAQPIKESQLMTGPIEPTSEGYAIAKIAGLYACKLYNQQYKTTRFIALIPNSMYGPNDRFDLARSHVLSALIRRFHDAKVAASEEVTLWGTGSPKREFIYCDDVAESSLFAVEHAVELGNRHYNIGSGADYSIKELAQMICDIVGYNGRIRWDTARPDGTPRKLLDSTDFMSLGWRPKVDIIDGIKRTYDWYLQQVASEKK